MLIGVISDTHDKTAGVDLAFEFFDSRNVSLVIHCGDWKSQSTVKYIADKARSISLPLHGVIGNNDTEEELLGFEGITSGEFEIHTGVFELDLGNGMLLAAYHGHHKPTLGRLLSENRHGIILLGHSHKPKIETLHSAIIVNPGSTAFSIPRSRTWKPSVAIVDTDTVSAELIYLS